MEQKCSKAIAMAILIPIPPWLKTVLQKQSKDNSGEKKKTVRPFYRGNLSGNPLFPLFNHLHLSLSRGLICLYSGHEH